MQIVGKPVNPYINALVVPYNEMVKKKNPDGTICDSFEAETTKYVRLYKYPTSRELLFKTLSMYARDMITAIIMMTNDGYQYTYITHDKVKELYGESYNYPKRRFDDTIRELLRHNIIDCMDKKKGAYWYNPSIFAAGNRINMFPMCKLKLNTIDISYNQ